METHQHSLESISKEAPQAAQKDAGLYKSSYEHDACGIGAIAHLKGIKSHSNEESSSF